MPGASEGVVHEELEVAKVEGSRIEEIYIEIKVIKTWIFKRLEP